MNYTKQTAINEDSFASIQLFEYMYKLKLINSIKAIVESNGGTIDLSKTDENGNTDYTTYSYRYKSWGDGIRYAYDFREDEIYFHIPGEDESDMNAEYEDLDIVNLSNILQYLYDYHLIHKTVT